MYEWSVYIGTRTGSSVHKLRLFVPSWKELFEANYILWHFDIPVTRIYIQGFISGGWFPPPWNWLFLWCAVALPPPLDFGIRHLSPLNTDIEHGSPHSTCILISYCEQMIKLLFLLILHVCCWRVNEVDKLFPPNRKYTVILYMLNN